MEIKLSRLLELDLGVVDILCIIKSKEANASDISPLMIFYSEVGTDGGIHNQVMW